MKYLSWHIIENENLSETEINDLYNKGYLATRIKKGNFSQTRSIRIKLADFSLSSENRRILKKTENLTMQKINLPFKEYHWQIGKTAKDFYETKFGKGIMSAQKVKELLTSEKNSNFNTFFIYKDLDTNVDTGFAICLMTNKILHYSYPFYDLNYPEKSIGLGMMIRAINFAKENGLEYIYLGSLQRPSDTYKMQFEGLEWFDGKEWKKDLGEAKKVLRDLAD